MNEPRAEKVAVVDEVRERLGGAAATVVTEYRGLSVAEMAQLRRNLGAVGGDYKVYKNTLVRLALTEGDTEVLRDLLIGPTALTFVHGDVSAVAKALRDFARTYPSLIMKGGLVEGNLLSQAQLNELADLPPREVLLARLAGGLQAPVAQLAGLLEALPRNLAYGLSALLDKLGGPPAETAEAAEGAEAPAAAPEAQAPDEAAEATASPTEAAETPGEPAEPEATAPEASEVSETPDKTTAEEN